MLEANISFYLKANRIHIFMNVLRRLGKPPRICFMIDEKGETLLIAPHKKKDFRSIAVPSAVYQRTGGMEVSSLKLCHIIADHHRWDLNCSYRVPGRIQIKQKVAVFFLKEAEIIARAYPEPSVAGRI